MAIFNGSEFRSSAPTTYGFAPSHVFAINDPDEVLYEYVSHDQYSIKAKPVANPALPQVFTQDEFRDLVKSGKVDPRHRENSDANKPRLRAASQLMSVNDLSKDEREQLQFYWDLCNRVERMCENGEASRSEGPLRKAIGTALAQMLIGGASLVPTRSRPGKRPQHQLPDERKIRARKSAPASFEAPSPSTVKGWLRTLNENDWDILALRDRRRERTDARSPRNSDPKATSLMMRWVREYLDRSRPSMATLYKLMVGSLTLEEENARLDEQGKPEIRTKDIPSFAAVNVERAQKGQPPLQVPSQSTFERAIRKLDPYEVSYAREGRGKARRKFRIGGHGKKALMPGERVLVDCWRSQLMNLKLPHEFWEGLDDELVGKLGKIRLTLCVAIDEATKVILGARLSVNATADTAIRTLEMVCRDKSDIAAAAGCGSSWDHTCTPTTVATDSGGEFIDGGFRFAVRDIGSGNEIGPAKHPDARGAIERFFRTLDMQLMPFFQGRTFSGVSDKGDYNPATHAHVLAEELGERLVRYIVDVYHNAEHASLPFGSPNDAWRELSERYVVTPPPARHIRQLVFGFSDNRRIQNRGVRFMGLFYRSQALGDLRRRVQQSDIRMRADLEDLGAIYVSENSPGAPWIKVPCELDMEGVPLAQWLEAAAMVRRTKKDRTKLTKAILIAALQHIRQAGRHSAAARGIGPSTISHEDIKRHEAKDLAWIEYTATDKRGQTFDGMDDDEVDITIEGVAQDDVQSDVDMPSGATEDPSEDHEDDAPPEPRMPCRRRRNDDDFFAED